MKGNDFGDQITFGCEIETVMTYSFFDDNHIDVGGYHFSHPLYLPGRILDGWKCEEDGSIIRDSSSTRTRGAEFISPVLRGVKGIQHVMDVVQFLKDSGAKVNDTTGFHVHVGAESVLSSERLGGVVEWVSNLLCLCSHYEPVLLAVSGKQCRIGNHYCGSVKTQWNQRSPDGKMANGRKKDLSDVEDDIDDIGRYCLLNIQPLFDSDKRTIEFRSFASTITPRKAAGYIWLAVALAHRATKIANPKFDDSWSDFSEVVSATKRAHKALKGWGIPISDELFEEIKTSQVLGAKAIAALHPAPTQNDD